MAGSVAGVVRSPKRQLLHDLEFQTGFEYLRILGEAKLLDSRKEGECASSAHSPVRGDRRVVRGCVLAFLLGVSSGCYTYPPLVTTPSPGVELRLDLNDRGRVGLGTLIGPAATKVEGVLRSPPDTAYELGVTYVTYVQGQSNRWNGEHLTVPKDFVATTTQRTFSMSRTWLTAAVVGGGIAALIASRSLSGRGSPGSGGGDGGGGGASFRGIGGWIVGGH